MPEFIKNNKLNGDINKDPIKEIIIKCINGSYDNYIEDIKNIRDIKNISKINNYIIYNNNIKKA